MSDTIDLVGRVGPTSNQDGIANPLQPRICRTGELMVSEVHPRYAEQAARDNIYILNSGSVTLASAHNSAGALGTIKFINGFYNPASSGYNAVIIAAAVQWAATADIPPNFNYNYFVGKAPTNAVTGTIRGARLTSVGSGNSRMSPNCNVALAVLPADTSTTGTALGLLHCSYTNPTTQIGGVHDDVQGRIVVPPGTLFGITKVGTSVVVCESTLVWEEVPI